MTKIVPTPESGNTLEFQSCKCSRQIPNYNNYFSGKVTSTSAGKFSSSEESHTVRHNILRQTYHGKAQTSQEESFQVPRKVRPERWRLDIETQNE